MHAMNLVSMTQKFTRVCERGSFARCSLLHLCSHLFFAMCVLSNGSVCWYIEVYVATCSLPCVYYLMDQYAGI